MTWLEDNMVSLAYTYDANKNKLTETIGGVMQPYGFTVPSGGYDAENRLVGWNRDDNNLNQSWGLSLAGDWNTFTENQSQQTRTHDPVHELTAIGGTALAYDAKGNLTTNANAQTYVWEFDNRMSAATVGANTHNYTYDALGRRVSKTVRDGENATTTVYINTLHALQHSPQAGQEVAEYVANAAPTAPSRKFVYGDYIDEPVMMVNVSGSSETKYYYHANSLYSVAALTDQSGTVVERYAYTAYGKPIILDANLNIISQSQISNPYLYTGRRLDAETGLQYSRARYYEFDLGRFVGRDPIGYEGGVDLYEYVGDAPLGQTDSTGLRGPIPAPPWAPPSPVPAPAPGGSPGGGIGGCCARILGPITIILCDPTECGHDDEIHPQPADPTGSTGTDCPPKPKPCTDEEKAQLQGKVKDLCKGANKGKRCTSDMSNSELLENQLKFEACANARDNINNTCFNGGDSGHRQASDDANRAARRCKDIRFGR